MHGELGQNPQEDSLTSYTCYMMPCLLSDEIAQIDSKPDTSAFMRDRSQVPYAKILTKYDCTKLHQIFVCGVNRKLERPEDTSALEMKISHGYRSGSTLRKIPYDTV